MTKTDDRDNSDYKANINILTIPNGKLYYLENGTNLCFVPDNINSLSFPDPNELFKMIGDLSIKLNKMQSDWREFEKQRINPLQEGMIKLSERIGKLESYINNQAAIVHQLERDETLINRIINLEERADLANECFAKLDNKLEEKIKTLEDKVDCLFSLDYIKSINDLRQRIEKLEDMEKHIDEIDRYECHNRALIDTLEKEGVDKCFERIEKLESLFKDRDAEKGCPEKQECEHNFVDNLRNYTKRCVHCGFEVDLRPFIKDHPRDTLKLCPHGVPVKMICTACY
jgi:hypothetical protein